MKQVDLILDRLLTFASSCEPEASQGSNDAKGILLKDGRSLSADARIRSEQLESAPSTADHDLLLSRTRELADNGCRRRRRRRQRDIVEMHCTWPGQACRSGDKPGVEGRPVLAKAR